MKKKFGIIAIVVTIIGLIVTIKKNIKNEK